MFVQNIQDFSPGVGITAYRWPANKLFPGIHAATLEAAWHGTSKTSAYLQPGTYMECTLVETTDSAFLNTPSFPLN